MLRLNFVLKNRFVKGLIEKQDLRNIEKIFGNILNNRRDKQSIK